MLLFLVALAAYKYFSVLISHVTSCTNHYPAIELPFYMLGDPHTVNTWVLATIA